MLPGIGSAGGFGGEHGDKETYYSSHHLPRLRQSFKYDIASGKSTLYAKPKVDFNGDDYETKQVFYTSKDGTKIPMFITHKKGLELNGKNPTMLVCIRGFNISLTPNFQYIAIGVVGERWRLYSPTSVVVVSMAKMAPAGTRMNKQNVFDDFIAAGEYLISEKYTSSPYLAIAGGSNGGLRWRYHDDNVRTSQKWRCPPVGVWICFAITRFTAGAGWAFDYGTADDSKEMMECLQKYSPCSCYQARGTYPATLVTTADHDDRAVPAAHSSLQQHSRKITLATTQYLSAST